jgi:hypothetical protein
MKKQVILIMFWLLCLLVSYTLPLLAGSDKIFSRDELIEDARQLARMLEEAHPDPYIHIGGKIAFHRRFQEALRTIPEQGMTRDRFYHHLLPFVAALKDSHTAIMNPGASEKDNPGLPLEFKIIEHDLVLIRVPGKENLHLLGARLLALEGVPVADLITRLSQLRGMENRYTQLALLTLKIKSTNGLKELLPGWKNKGHGDRIRVKLRLANGKEKEFFQSLSGDSSLEVIKPPSRISRPSTRQSDIAYNFLDQKKKNVLLVIDNMMRYREGCESWFASGLSQALPLTKAAYRYFHKKDPPDDREKLLKGIPSASDAFMQLINDMKTAGSENLIVDLRKNTGGNSVMIYILIYFLYGDQVMKSMNNNYSIKKYSRLYFENYQADSLKKINLKQPVPLIEYDYDFEEERDPGTVAIENSVITAIKKMPGFWQVYESGKYHHAVYRPGKVMVLCSPFTYSSGFNMLTALYRQGAVLIGTPSAQPPNNFGDTLISTLKNTGIRCGISYKRIITFPGDPEKGNCLQVDHLLTYDKLASYGFDPNAEVLLALEVLKKK